MIYNFGVRNFLSFKEGIDVSFELNKNCPDFISQGKGCTTLLCVKGNNASGKTNVLKALLFLHEFCRDSFTKINFEESINVKPFYDSKEPIDFYMEYSNYNGGERLIYELTISEGKVQRESLSEKKKSGNIDLLFVREENEVTECIKELDELQSIKLRSNASISSTAFQHEINLMMDMFGIFGFKLQDVKNNIQVKQASSFFYSNLASFEFTKEIILKADTGIEDIELKKSEENKGEYYPLFHHTTASGIRKLTFKEESSGTQRLYLVLWNYFIALEFGMLLIADEFDIHLHPHIAPLLLDLFTNPEINPKGAQFIFTTHDTQLMDRMGKYRTFLVNKEDNESYGYRLDELSTKGSEIRNDRLLSPLYNAGKLGGVPRL